MSDEPTFRAAQIISGFDWDDANVAHCGKHGLSTAAIEGAFTRAVAILPDPVHSRDERRHRAICSAPPGRAIFIVFTIRERDGARLIRPISARYMHAKEIAHYEEANPQLRDG